MRIDDEAEADFVAANLASDSWLSATDSGMEGVWRWSDNGVPFWLGQADGTALSSRYSRWADGQPDAASDAEDCATLQTDGTWSDRDCRNVAAFVCEVGSDRCPEDEAKLDPGQCGCGEPDIDDDEDGFAECDDECPDDGAKTAPGACGCGVPDTDSDGDGLPDCDDECPEDPDKVERGACGCGIPETNSDGDSELDCNEECDTDPDKLAPGACGCGNPDNDADGDGAADCVDACPQNPLGSDAASGCGLGFAPANVDLADVEPQHADATTVIDCQAVLDTSGTPRFSTWCSGARPAITVQAQAGGGPELAVVALRGLNLRSSGRLTIRGSRPAALLVFGAATIAGVIDASASGTTPGAGGDVACGASAGGDVTTCSSGSDETGGGGGGGFGTAGGRGGDGDDCGGRPGGVARGTSALVPLIGGCRGGAAGLCSGYGAGGGAFQLSVGGTLTLTGTLRANGAVGPARCTGSSYYGGGGGGSGGAIRVEALGLTTSGATVEVNGGGGGNTTTSSGTGTGGDGSTSPSSPGGNATNATPNPQPDTFGGGGGGGGYGRVVLCNRSNGSGCP